MAKKTVLGIDIGHDSLKMALVRGNQIRKTVIVPLPDKFVHEGKIVSIEAMGSLIRETIKKNKMNTNQAALVLNSEDVFLRNVSMPIMTEEQLIYNLPYEFRDYITEELGKYIFDYAMISQPEEILLNKEGENKSMELMAVAVPAAMIEESKSMLRKAGLKLVMAAPVVSAYASMIRSYMEFSNSQIHEYGILDIGYNTIRMYMYRGDCHIVTRVLEIGMATVAEAVADAYNVDIHLAHSYVQNNHDNCLYNEICQLCFDRIGVELMRAINFYRFSNPDSELNDIFLCGGGAAIEPLKQSIRENMEMDVHLGNELVQDGDNYDQCYRLIPAIGITQE